MAVKIQYRLLLAIQCGITTTGAIQLCYEDGSVGTIPLVSGDNMGSILGNYSENTYKVPLKSHAKDSASHYCIYCDSSKILESIQISIDKDDVGTWAERYIDNKPAGVRFRSWESAINIDALIKYAEISEVSNV